MVGYYISIFTQPKDLTVETHQGASSAIQMGRPPTSRSRKNPMAAAAWEAAWKVQCPIPRDCPSCEKKRPTFQGTKQMKNVKNAQKPPPPLILTNVTWTVRGSKFYVMIMKVRESNKSASEKTPLATTRAEV